MVGLLAAVIVVGLVTGPALRLFEGSGAPVRVAVAAALVAVAGLFMGTALPLGMRFAADRAQGLVPWLWGVNGATSVFGSVLAAAVALAYGISTSYWAGVVSYAVAALALAWGLGKVRPHETQSSITDTTRGCHFGLAAAAPHVLGRGLQTAPEQSGSGGAQLD
jgi:hypothetical protein